MTFRPNPLLVVGFLGLALFSIQDLRQELASDEPSLAVMVLAVVAVAAFVFLSLQRVTVSAQGLDILGITGRRVIAWDDIAGFEERKGHPIKVRTPAGKSHALGAVNLGTKQDRDRFEAIIRQRRNDPGDGVAGGG